MIKRQRFSSNRGSRCLFCLADDPTLLPAAPRFLSHASFIKEQVLLHDACFQPELRERVLPGKLVPDEPFDPDIHRPPGHSRTDTRSLPPFCPHRPVPSNGQKVLHRAGKPAFSGPVCPLPPAAPHAARSGCGSQDRTPAAPAPRHSRALLLSGTCTPALRYRCPAARQTNGIYRRTFQLQQRGWALRRV